MEALLAARLDDLSRLFSDIALSLTSGAGTNLSVTSQSYLGSTIYPITFSLEPMDYKVVWPWFVGSLVGSWLLFRVRRLHPPLRLIGSFGLAVVAASALYLLFFGHLGYEGEAFSILYVRTNALVWLLAPLVMGTLSLALPFTSVERLGSPRILRFSLGTKVLTLPPARGNLSRPRGVIVDEGQNRRNTRLARVV
jgi:hypothetical protein